MRAAVPFLALALSSPALAGGIGVMLTGGFHTQDVYFYSDAQDFGAGPNYASASDYEQLKATEYLGNTGAGFEFVLGDRDSRFQGIFRGYWLMDTPEYDPSKSLGLSESEQSHIIGTWREELRHTGVGTVGLQWMPVGDTDAFTFGFAVHVGAGFITLDKTEYLLAQLGPVINYRVARNMVVWVDLNGTLRFRKNASGGISGNAGLRVLFD